MPATKIETGIHIELKRLVLSPIARKHSPEKSASLAKSIKELNQQLEDILVCPQDEAAGQASSFFEVLAGGGRKEAEESLGWEKARCTIMYGLSAYEKLKVTLDENEEREATTPLDDARIYQAMKDAEPGLTQEKLAERLGMTRSKLADYLSLLQLQADVQEIVARATNLKIKHILQICRLKASEEQIKVAKQASEGEWTVKKLTVEVKKRLVKAPSPSPLPKGRGPTPTTPSAFSLQGEGGRRPDEGPADPLADLWSSLHKNPEFTPEVEWEAKYGLHKTGPDVSLKGWFFFVGSYPEVSKLQLARWFQQMARALSLSESLEEQAGGSVMPPEAMATQTIEKSLMQAMNPRLPQTMAEEAELRDLAIKSGPRAVYAWIYGEQSPMPQMAPKTWEEVGDSPTEGLKKVLEGIQMMQGILPRGQ